MEFEARSLEDTRQFGEALGRKLQPGDIVLLFGDLGSGKTTLTQSLAVGLGVPKTEYVSSPTFTLINHYPGRCPVYHIDLYRLDSRLALQNLGLEEFLFDEGVSIIEWAEKLLLPENGKYLFGIDSRLEIHIETKPDDARKIKAKSFGLANRIP